MLAPRARGPWFNPRCKLNKFFARIRCKSTYLYISIWFVIKFSRNSSSYNISLTCLVKYYSINNVHLIYSTKNKKCHYFSNTLLLCSSNLDKSTDNHTWSEQGWHIRHPNCIRLDPHATNLVLFKISFSTFWLDIPGSNSCGLYFQ